MPLKDRKLETGERVDITRSPDHPRITVVLDNVRSGHNVGSVFRTADAFGVECLVLCGYTACPPDREVRKTALGASESVPWRHVQRTLDAVSELKATGHFVIAVEQTEHAVPLTGATDALSTPLALVFGNELHGVDPGVVALSDMCLSLPQFGTKGSLNVAVCAGAVLWEMVRRHDPRGNFGISKP